ncbi:MULTISPECIES: MarR family transcriptional regulator [Bacillus]|uniref:MarR family transcriptional regulator n=1 Tax=Bacillus TaxID=1386 RepID=UPI0020BEE3F7|nr:hypothetical protein [Bacillus altitudinis]
MFETELDLVNFFVDSRSKKNNRKIITELSTNFGRPDIVELIFSNDILENRRRKFSGHEIFINRDDSYILTYLFGKNWVNKDTILKYLNISKPSLERAIERLVNRGLIMVELDKIKQFPKTETLAITQINVYEAKLSNWKYVIAQAERHFWFSKNSAILIPELSQSTLDNCNQVCLNNNIELFVANKKKIKSWNGNEITRKTGVINTPLLWELNEKLIDGRF